MGNIINDLKKIIFASKVGKCYSASEWQNFYKQASSELPIKHLASCSDCLDIVNQLHSIPTLSERNPFDTIDRDGSDGNSTPFNSSNSSSVFSEKSVNSSLLLKKLEENRQKRFEYLPREVTFCVNGWPFTSSTVEAGTNRFILRPKLDEGLESLELLDERGELLCHILLSENSSDLLKQSVAISPNQQVNFSIIWLEDYPEINLEYSDKRILSNEVKESSFLSSLSNFIIKLQDFFPRRLVFASAVVALFVISIVAIQVFWQRKFENLQQDLAKINSEKQLFQNRLTKAETLSQTLENDLVRLKQEQLEQTNNPSVIPNIPNIPNISNIPKIELPKIDPASKIKLALAVAAQNTITNLIYNTRAVMSPILLQRGTQSVFGVRLPKYEENSQQEFTSYIVKFNLPKQKPFTQQIKLPANSADPAFISIEVKIYNTDNISANTMADAVIIGVVGNQEVKIDTIPLKFE